MTPAPWWTGAIAIVVALIGATAGSVLFRSPRQITRESIKSNLALLADVRGDAWETEADRLATKALLETLILNEVQALRAPGKRRSSSNRSLLTGSIIISLGSVVTAFFLNKSTVDQSALIYALLLIAVVASIAALRALLD